MQRVFRVQILHLILSSVTLEIRRVFAIVERVRVHLYPTYECFLILFLKNVAVTRWRRAIAMAAAIAYYCRIFFFSPNRLSKEPASFENSEFIYKILRISSLTYVYIYMHIFVIFPHIKKYLAQFVSNLFTLAN